MLPISPTAHRMLETTARPNTSTHGATSTIQAIFTRMRVAIGGGICDFSARRLAHNRPAAKIAALKRYVPTPTKAARNKSVRPRPYWTVDATANAHSKNGTKPTPIKILGPTNFDGASTMSSNDLLAGQPRCRLRNRAHHFHGRPVASRDGSRSVRTGGYAALTSTTALTDDGCGMV